MLTFSMKIARYLKYEICNLIGLLEKDDRFCSSIQQFCSGVVFFYYKLIRFIKLAVGIHTNIHTELTEFYKR